jgi:hypothetical protein
MECGVNKTFTACEKSSEKSSIMGIDQPALPQVAKADMVETASGLVVPRTSVPIVPTEGTTDPDGRQRIVMDRTFDLMAKSLCAMADKHNLGVGVRCQPGFTHKDHTPHCGKFMKQEDVGGPDEGIGCDCTRIHFSGAVPSRRNIQSIASGRRRFRPPPGTGKRWP